MLRRKYDALRSGQLMEESDLERFFKPISSPLEKLTNNRNNNFSEIHNNFDTTYQKKL